MSILGHMTIDPQMSVQYCLLKLCQRGYDVRHNPGYDIKLTSEWTRKGSGNKAGPEGSATRDGP